MGLLRDTTAAVAQIFVGALRVYGKENRTDQAGEGGMGREYQEISTVTGGHFI